MPLWPQELLNTIQEYAADYFKTVFKTRISFWDMPPLPSGANILTGAFAGFLITGSRFERSLPTDFATLRIIFSLVFVYILFVSAVSLLADPSTPNRFREWRLLVSVVAVATSLGCGLVAFAWILNWTLPLDYLSNSMGLHDEGGNRVVAVAAGALISIILFAKTAYDAGGLLPVLRSARTMIWSFVFFCIVSLGISLVLLGI